VELGSPAAGRRYPVVTCRRAHPSAGLQPGNGIDVTGVSLRWQGLAATALIPVAAFCLPLNIMMLSKWPGRKEQVGVSSPAVELLEGLVKFWQSPLNRGRSIFLPGQPSTGCAACVLLEFLRQLFDFLA